MIYATEDVALRRIEYLKRSGIWPGYYRVPGGWQLTFDPTWLLDSHGYAF